MQKHWSNEFQTTSFWLMPLLYWGAAVAYSNPAAPALVATLMAIVTIVHIAIMAVVAGCFVIGIVALMMGKPVTRPDNLSNISVIPTAAKTTLCGGALYAVGFWTAPYFAATCILLVAALFVFIRLLDS